MAQHRRRNYLINRTLQLYCAFYIFATLLLVSLASAACLSFGLWEKVLNEFSSSSISNRMQIASHITDYENARLARQNIPSAERARDFKDFHLLSVRDKEILEESLKENNIELAIKSFFLFVVISIGTVFLTHKVAGPLFRFQKTFEDITNGNLATRVYLRKGDQAQEILPQLNAMIGSLDYSFSKLKLLKQKLFDELREQNVSSETINEYEEHIAQELNRYQTSDAFKI